MQFITLQFLLANKTRLFCRIFNFFAVRMLGHPLPSSRNSQFVHTFCYENQETKMQLYESMLGQLPSPVGLPANVLWNIQHTLLRCCFRLFLLSFANEIMSVLSNQYNFLEIIEGFHSRRVPQVAWEGRFNNLLKTQNSDKKKLLPAVPPLQRCRASVPTLRDDHRNTVQVFF